MKKSFLLFRDGRRLRAAHLESPKENTPLLVNGRRFAPAGNLAQWSHIIDSEKRLVGFVVDALENATTSPGWREWWNTFDNRHLDDFWEAYLFLADPFPAEWHHDCAFLIGGSVYTDDSRDFILTIPDESAIFGARLGFELSEMKARQEDRKSDT